MAKDDTPEQPPQPPDYVDEERRTSLREAMARALEATPTRPAFDRRRRKKLIELLATGATLAEAAAAIGMSVGTVHRARRLEPELDEAITLALELGCDPVLARLQAIALYGDPGSMATVRAAETYLQGHHRQYRRQPGSSKATIEQVSPDGTVRRISASSNLIAD